jgi:hypothetical protein
VPGWIQLSDVGIRGGDGMRAMRLQNPILPKGDQILLTTSIRLLRTSQEGTAQRLIRGPGASSWDISIIGTWPIASENRRREFRFEMYAWNHTQILALDTIARFASNGSQTNQRFGRFDRGESRASIPGWLALVF